MSVIRKAYIDTKAGQLHYRSSSIETRGSAIVFFHRCPVTSASFNKVLTAMSEFRPLIAFDLPGFGESYTPKNGVSISDMSQSFIEALDKLSIETVHLVGHHTGAHFAAELAHALQSRALSLMIDGAMVSSAQERRKVTPPNPAPTITRDGTYAQTAWRFLEPYYTIFDAECIHNEFVGALSSSFTRSNCMDAVRNHNMENILKEIACPVMATCAEDDVFEPHLDRILASKPDALVKRYGAAGIASPELQTETFCELLKSLVSNNELDYFL